MNSIVNLDKIKERFIVFAEYECKETAFTYYHLSKSIAQDTELLEMASHTRIGQPIPNMFFAAVHYQLLINSNSLLSTYYPSISKSINLEPIPFSIFKEFCIKHSDSIIDLLREKIVQTNVIGRCAYLMPIISTLIHKANKEACVVDIGTSAGLTLLFDRYSYNYKPNYSYGKSTVTIHCELQGTCNAPIHSIQHKIHKVGIDQHLVIPTDASALLWLQALVWTDHIDRFNTMQEALELLKREPIEFIETSQISIFEKKLHKIPDSQLLIVYATHVLYQFSPEQKVEFYAMLDRIGKHRDLYFISAESTQDLLQKYNTTHAVVELISYLSGYKNAKMLAETNGHANYIRWVDEI